jgi:hypothetical protein
MQRLLGSGRQQHGTSLLLQQIQNKTVGEKNASEKKSKRRIVECF